MTPNLSHVAGLELVKQEVSITNPLAAEQLEYLIEQAKSAPAEPVYPCRWVRDEDNETYETACGSTWHYTDGGFPGEHGQLYCHHCGKPIDDEVAGHE